MRSIEARLLLLTLTVLPISASARVDPFVQMGTVPCVSSSNVPTINNENTGSNCIGPTSYDYKCLQSGLNYGEGFNPPTTGTLHFQNDAMTHPQTFAIPKDAGGNYITVNFKLVMEEAGYENIFGWYNVGAAAPADHYPALFSCYGGNIWHPPTFNTTPSPPTVNNDGHEFSVNFQTEFTAGRYAGGKIGFYLVTPEGTAGCSSCAGMSSAQGDRGVLGVAIDDARGVGDADDNLCLGRTYYSETAYNIGETDPHFLIYQSKTSPTHFYFAMEDTFNVGGGDKDYDDILVKVEGLISALSGDYVISPPGVTTSGTNITSTDWGLISSVEYPGWKGHLRAYDLTQNPPTLKWDVATTGSLDPSGDYTARRIFTGFPDYDSGGFIKLLKDDGSNVDNGNKIRDVLGKVNSAYSALSDAQLKVFFEWLYGRNRTHRLPPVLRCVPASVSVPKARSLTGHAAFVGSISSREPLIYATSNEGLIHAFRNGEAANNGGEELFAFLPPALFDKAYELYLAGGQPNPPISFKYILANSPRVDDVYDGSNWATQLVVAFGPYSKGYVVLDITNPSDCSSTPCSLTANNLKVVALAYLDGSVKFATASGNTSFSPQSFGEGWSIPALYWDVSAGAAVCRASSGSGYGAATSSDNFVANPATAVTGHYYNYFATPWGVQPATYLLSPPASPNVDYAVIADTAAAMNWDAGSPVVIATYQVDLNGRLVRFNKGAVAIGDDTVLLAADETRPFYYAPAVLHIGGTVTDQVVLALNSGSADEGCPPSPDITSNIYLRAHTTGATFDAGYSLTCAVGSISTCSANLDTSKITDSSLWPPTSAKPVSPPLLLYNDPGTGTQRVEAFYLLYDNATKTSYRIRIAVDTTDPTKMTVEEVYKTPGRLGGMALAGGGTRVIMSKSGTGGSTPASVDHMGNPVVGGAALTPPNVESWREVR